MLGKCNQCGCEIYNIIQTFKDGTVKRVGDPLENCREIHLILVNGNTMKITICKECEPDFPYLHKHALEGWKDEIDNNYRVSHGIKPLTSEQLKQATETLFSYIDNIPLGIL